MRNQHISRTFFSKNKVHLPMSLAVAAILMNACGGDDTSTTSNTVAPPVGSVSQPSSPVSQPSLGNSQTGFLWPKDHSIADPNHYAAVHDADAITSASYRSGPNGGQGDRLDDVAKASLDLATIDETPSVKHHRIQVGGKMIEYTASAGHLIAWAPKDIKEPEKKDAQASIFYMAYTRDDLPHDQRPVTFLFNGGPGEPSIWLHLGSWAPKRLKVDSPTVPTGPDIPDSFPLIDNEQTLLDKTDLVFVDIVGSGYSEAIAPHRNKDFWNTDADAGIFRDFITAYINKNNRQSSPKYLMGESFSGVRTPIVANLLVQAGTRDYSPDPLKKRAIALSGMVLQSPILDYGYVSTNKRKVYGFIPTLGMVSDYYGKAVVGKNMRKDEFVSYLKDFSAKEYMLAALADGRVTLDLAEKLSGIIGLNPVFFMGSGTQIAWGTTAAQGKKIFSLSRLIEGSKFNILSDAIYPNEKNVLFNSYDGRMSKVGGANYDFSQFESAAFYGAIKPLLLDQFGYMNLNDNQIYGADSAFDYWGQIHRDSESSSVQDIVEVLTFAPDVEILVLHGYHDGVTPFYQTERDLMHVGLLDEKGASMNKNLTMKVDDGGHMEYLTEASRIPMRQALDKFYGP